jgi:hypothetical protein
MAKWFLKVSLREGIPDAVVAFLVPEQPSSSKPIKTGGRADIFIMGYLFLDLKIVSSGPR